MSALVASAILLNHSFCKAMLPCNGQASLTRLR